MRLCNSAGVVKMIYLHNFLALYEPSCLGTFILQIDYRVDVSKADIAIPLTNTEFSESTFLLATVLNALYT